MGIGVDISYGLDFREFSGSFSKGFQSSSLKFGFGNSETVGEFHFLYNTTETVESSDIYSKYIAPPITEISIKIKQIEYNIRDYIFEKILQGYGYGN